MDESQLREWAANSRASPAILKSPELIPQPQIFTPPLPPPPSELVGHAHQPQHIVLFCYLNLFFPFL